MNMMMMMITNVHKSSCKVPFIFVRFFWNLNYQDNFEKDTQVSNFMEKPTV